MNKNKRFKLTTSTANLLCDYVNDYGGEDVLQTNGKFIKCKNMQSQSKKLKKVLNPMNLEPI